jgi:hypothetical protein
MMAEDRAAKIVHRLLSPHSPWEQFQRILVSQQRPPRQLAPPLPPPDAAPSSGRRRAHPPPGDTHGGFPHLPKIAICGILGTRASLAS